MTDLTAVGEAFGRLEARNDPRLNAMRLFASLDKLPQNAEGANRSLLTKLQGLAFEAVSAAVDEELQTSGE